jgi:NADPH:quinone reductase-like Zn-dependent oxidoreductase
MDNAGTAPFSRVKGVLRPGGRLLMVLGDVPDLLGALWGRLTTGKKFVFGSAGEGVEILQQLAELAEQGKFRPIIDRTYPLERAADAHAYVDAGHKRGNVVLTVA